MNKRAAIYCRVSTGDQTNDGQEKDLIEFAARRGWAVAKIYTDTISGLSASRPGLDLLLTDARAGKIDVVLAVKLDRLGRSLIHLSLLVGEFARLKIALVCTSQGIDTSADNPAGMFQLQVLGAVAEFERQMIAERTRAGLRSARSRGRHPGRRPFSADLRAKAVELARAGKTIRSIAAELKVSTGSIQNYVQAARAKLAVEAEN